MATVTSSVGGQTVAVSNATQSVSDLANTILQASGLTAATGNTTLQNTFFATTAPSATVTGGASVTVGVLAGQNGLFATGASQASQIVAGDNTNSSIVNNNVNGSLIAFTGAGGNALVGGGLINGFQTGIGGQDAVILGSAGNGIQVNALTSQGQDTVSIVGRAGTQTNVITAAGTGSDSVALTSGASLNFVNMSTTTSTIVGSSGSNLNIVGTGNTSVVASANESFGISTASGNVTLVGSAAGNDTFNFVRLGTAASNSVDIVGNFTSADTINLSGYAGYNAVVSNGSTVLSLSDGSQVIFAGITDASQITSRLHSA